MGIQRNDNASLTMQKISTFEWLRQHISHTGDECLTWPFGRDSKGYGQCSAFDKIRKAHRLMCILANGEPPSRKHQASHTCGNGHLGCVNPKHLRWQTNSENQLERYRVHGRRDCNTGGPKGKLTPAEAKQVMALRGKLSISKIAEKFGVKRGAVDYWHKKVRENHRAVD